MKLHRSAFRAANFQQMPNVIPGPPRNQNKSNVWPLPYGALGWKSRRPGPMAPVHGDPLGPLYAGAVALGRLSRT